MNRYALLALALTSAPFAFINGIAGAMYLAAAFDSQPLVQVLLGVGCASGTLCVLAIAIALAAADAKRLRPDAASRLVPQNRVAHAA